MPSYKRDRPTIGVLVGYQVYEGMLLQSFPASIFRGIESAALEHNCNLLVACGVGSVLGPGAVHTAWPTLASDADFVPVGPGNTDGLIILNPILSSERSRDLERFAESGQPIVYVCGGRGRPTVLVDNGNGIRQALQHLMDHGHKRIAFLAGDEEPSGDGRERLEHFRMAVMEFGLQVDSRLIIPGYHNQYGGQRAAQQLLASGVEFTAILASNDESAFGAMQALRQAGRRVPQDVAIVGFDDNAAAIAQVPALTTIRYPTFESGHRALELLISRLQGTALQSEVVRLPTQLAVRKSCGCQPGMPSADYHRPSGEEGVPQKPGPRRRPSDRERVPSRPELVEAMATAIPVEGRRLSAEQVRSLCSRLLDGVTLSLERDDESNFRAALTDVLQQVEAVDDDLRGWQAAVSALRQGILPMVRSPHRSKSRWQAEGMFHQARVTISESAEGRHGRQRFQESLASYRLNVLTTRLHELTGRSEIGPLLAERLPELGIRGAHVAFFEPDGADPVAWSRHHLPVAGGQRGSGTQDRFPTHEFPPPSLWPEASSEPLRLALLPLVFHGERLGYVAFEGTNLEPCAAIAQQLAAAVKSAGLLSETRRQRDELEALVDISSAVRTAATRAEILPVVLDRVLNLVGAEAAALALRDPAERETVIELARGAGALPEGVRLPAGEGVVGQVIASGKAYVSSRASGNSSPAPRAPGGGWNAVACVPLVAQEHVLGALWVGRQTPIGDGELRLLNAISDIAANAIRRVMLHEQTEGRLQQLMALQAVEMAINSSLDLRVTLNVLLDQVTTQLRVDAADILLFNAHTQELEFAAGRGASGLAMRRPLRVGEGHAGQAALERRALWIANLRDAPDPRDSGLMDSEGFVSYYAAPLLAKGQVKGVLEVFHRAALSDEPEWLAFLEALVGQAAIAIDNAELFERIRQSNVELALAYDTTLEGWSRALDLRDAATEGHTRRVTEMSLRLARAMGMGERELVHLRRGALLHDIGKMGVPDRILLKPGPLDDDEWEIMRQHPVYAHDMLTPIHYLRPALEVPYCHHEHWDGSGYPRGLKGEAIPLAARIFAVADVWDALLSDRPYRKAWPADRVIEHVQALAGSHLDQDAVATFMSLVKSAGD